MGVYSVPARGDVTHDAGVLHIPYPDAALFGDATTPSACRPGRYDGTFSCNFAFGAACGDNTGTGGLALSGPLSLTLTEGQSGEILEVSGGTLDASSGGFTLNGPLAGSLNCRSGLLQGSFDGTYTSPALPPLPGISGQISGPIQSAYDPRKPELTNGTWCLTATNPNTSRADPCADIPTGQPGSCLAGSCKGTWNAVYVQGT